MANIIHYAGKLEIGKHGGCLCEPTTLDPWPVSLGRWHSKALIGGTAEYVIERKPQHAPILAHETVFLFGRDIEQDFNNHGFHSETLS